MIKQKQDQIEIIKRRISGIIGILIILLIGMLCGQGFYAYSEILQTVVVGIITVIIATLAFVRSIMGVSKDGN